MEDAQRVSHLPKPLPAAVTIGGTPDMRLTPNQMRALKAETGMTLEQLIGDNAEDANRLQAIVWLELRRQGYEASWDEIGDVAIEFQPEEPDPTSGGSSTSSPPSVASGA